MFKAFQQPQTFQETQVTTAAAGQWQFAAPIMRFRTPDNEFLDTNKETKGKFWNSNKSPTR